jgi:hypothetical protein
MSTALRVTAHWRRFDDDPATSSHIADRLEDAA